MGEVSYVLRYTESVVRKDIPAVPKKERRRIERAIEEKLVMHPEIFGKPLRKSLSGFRSLRVGDYRVIYRIEGTAVRIYIIAHRSVVYTRTE